MIKHIFILFLLMIVLIACDKKNDVMIRIENASTYNIQSVLLNTSGGEANYDSIPASGISDYQKFDFTYRYAYIKAIIDGEEFIMQPKDYIGERKLRKGNYRFKLSVIDYANRQLSSELIEE